MHINKLLIVVLIFTLYHSSSYAKPSKNFHLYDNNLDVYFYPEQFNWKEFSETGDRLLKDSGTLYAIGFSGSGPLSKEFSFNPKLYRVIAGGRFEYYWGSVDYDGQTWEGAPVKTDTIYKGMLFDGWMGWHFKITHTFGLGPIFGVGLNLWTRDIKSTSTAIGYEEDWQIYHFLLGANSEKIFPGMKFRIFAKAGVNIPFDNTNEADFGGCQKAKVHPDKYVPSVFTEGGFQLRKLKCALYYNSFEFDQSDVDDEYKMMLQPKSKAETLGVRIALSF